MKKFISNISLCLTFAFIIIFTTNAFLPMNGNEIYSSVIRLHVIANSNNESDQKVKLLVRDSILENASKLFEGESFEDAKLLIGKNIIKLEEIAKKTLEDNGFNYNVSIMTGIENYPTREYDGISFPAGDYYSLRIILGDGDGENWWCVLFPPLCIGASMMREKIKITLPEEGIKIITREKPQYKFKFKILEWFNRE